MTDHGALRAALLELGNRRPVAIVPIGRELCILTADGTILFVRS